MTHELILTSVTKGLEKDSRGFCAVACDKNIPASLVKRLNTISSYRYLSPPDSPESQHLPVVYSHYIVHTLDTIWSVLSRIAPLGWDFEHSPNHLVHHIALTEEERCKEGPAWLLGLAGFHLTEWYTPPVRFTTGRSIPSLTAPAPLTRRQLIARECSWLDDAKMSLHIPSEETPEMLAEKHKENESQLFIKIPPSCPCPLWKEITGDAAWGGTLAETVRTGQHAAVIYEPGTNILPLFVEALSILPREYLWRATFTTFFTGLPEHIVCQWKGAVAGSKEAEDLSQQSDILLIDITKPFKAAPQGMYADYARSGNDNLLPEHETDNDFLESPDFDTKPFIIEDEENKDQNTPFFGSATDGVQDNEDGHTDIPSKQGAGEFTLSPFASVESSPARKPEVVVRSHSKHRKGAFSSFLNMKSKTQFYLLYTVTFALIGLLLVLVLDQFFHFRLFSTKNHPQITQQTAPEQKTESKDSKAGDKLDEPPAPQDKPAEKEQAEKEQAEKNNRREVVKAAEAGKQNRLALAKKKRDEIEKKTEEQKTALKPVLDDFIMPPFLPLLSPSLKQTSPENTSISLPEAPQVFSEFKPLFQYASGLKIDFVPLLTLPKTTVITEKQKFYEDSENTAEDDVPDEERIPDISRFEWLVLSVNTENSQKMPLFLIKVISDGLSIEWQQDGLAPQHFYNTLWTSLAFLQCSVEGSDETVKSVQLFKPLESQPFCPNKEFDGQDKTEFTVLTPFAKEPWKTLWTESPAPPFSLVLETKILPDLENKQLTGIKAFQKNEEVLPFRFFVEIQTDVDSQKKIGNDIQYTPVNVPLEGIAGPDKIVWSDRCKDRIKQLQDEKEENNKTLDEKAKELDKVKQQIVSGLPKEEAALLRTKRNEIQTAVNELKIRSGEIDDIFKKLPEAQKRVLANADLQIEYSLKMTRTDSAVPALLLVRADTTGDTYAKPDTAPVIPQKPAAEETKPSE